MPKIRYIKNEFRFGITEYKTPCPFGMRDRYALHVYEVASRMCKDCPHFVKDDQFNSVLTCSYQEKPEQQEKEHQEKNVFNADDIRKTVKELQEYGVKAESILKKSGTISRQKEEGCKAWRQKEERRCWMIRGRWSLPGKAFQLSTMIAIIACFNKSFRAGILCVFLVLVLISIYNKENEKEEDQK